MSIKHCTLLFLRRDNETLLAMKKRGFGAGKYDGVGGKIEPSETIEQALIRECQEEINVTPTKYFKVAEADFHEYHDGQPAHVHVHVYFCDDWQGEPIETEEMRPQWFNMNNIPYQQMWAGDKYWLPRVLAGDKIVGSFVIDDSQTVTSYNIEVVKEF